MAINSGQDPPTEMLVPPRTFTVKLKTFIVGEFNKLTLMRAVKYGLRGEDRIKIMRCLSIASNDVRAIAIIPLYLLKT